MLKVACMGLGWVTQNRHIPALRRHPGVQLVGVIDRSEDRAREVANRLGVSWATTLDAPWMAPVQALTIGTPPDSHHAIALAALARGLHVLTEKPFAMNPADGRAMIAAAADAKRILAVVHNFQFARSVAKARQRFESGQAGELKSVLGLQFSSHARRLPSWYKKLPGGLFYDEAPHLFYLVRSFLSDFAMTQANVVKSLDPADNTPRLVSTVHGQGRAVGSVQMFFDAAVSEWQLVLMGSRETLVADIFRDILVRLPPDHRHEGRDVLRTSAFAMGTHLLGTLSSGVLHASKRLDYGNSEVVRRFVAAVETGNEPQGISGHDGLAVIEAMASVLAASVPG
jgi:scyllo-inositol 2-dehydrogenase (NADP+)